MNQERIGFEKERDFSSTLTVSFTFIKENFKLFFSSLMFLAGPLLLLNAILMSIYVQNVFNFQTFNPDDFENLQFFSPIYFIVIIIAIASSLVVLGVTYEYIFLYDKHNGAKFTVNDVWNAFLKDLGMLISTFFFLVGIFILIMIVLGLVIGLFAMMGGILMGLIMFVLFIALMVVGPPLLFVITAVYPIRIKERIGNFAALNKAYLLAKNNFGNTWILIFISQLIVGAIGFVFSLPQFVYTMIIQLNTLQNTAVETSSVLLTSFNVIATVGTNLTNVIFLVIVVFHYFSCNEKVFGGGLMKKIDAIGNTSEDNEDITI